MRATSPIIEHLLPACEDALQSAYILLGKIKDSVSGWRVRDGTVDGALIDAVQFAARVLNIFKGAAEIQAQVIARGMLASQK